jgi:hypothetical protein
MFPYLEKQKNIVPWLGSLGILNVNSGIVGMSRAFWVLEVC